MIHEGIFKKERKIEHCVRSILLSVRNEGIVVSELSSRQAHRFFRGANLSSGLRSHKFLWSDGSMSSVTFNISD